MLVHIKKIISSAKKNGYCVGAFNVHNIESIKGVAVAAQKAKSPAIIQVSEGTIDYIGIKSIVCLVEELTGVIAPKIPFSLHLDHGKKIDLIYRCIEAGFRSVHMDASRFELGENIKITKRVVNYAKKRGVWVQGELGEIKGGHGKVAKRIGSVPLANPENVIEFVKATNIDTFSAAIGTAHGSFEDENISYELLASIKNKLSKPFVLHGGSGVPDRQIKKAIKMGVNIINVGTDVKVAFCEGVIKQAIANRTETDPRILLTPTVNEVSKMVYKKMKLFGSFGKA